jgi:hypothetical protein
MARRWSLSYRTDFSLAVPPTGHMPAPHNTRSQSRAPSSAQDTAQRPWSNEQDSALRNDAEGFQLLHSFTLSKLELESAQRELKEARNEWMSKGQTASIDAAQYDCLSTRTNLLPGEKQALEDIAARLNVVGIDTKVAVRKAMRLHSETQSDCTVKLDTVRAWRPGPDTMR